MLDHQLRDARSSSKRPSTGEAPFQLGEVFFSRTDERGVIKSGNALFQTVSAYEWSELLGAPHKVIRHPDMPKGVFRVFWQELQAGRVTGAYVKNRAKDGLYYWVFALVSPCAGGFISARIKPTSAHLDTVKELYGQLLEKELSGELSTEESAQRLLDTLKDSGFPEYRDFIVAALGAEVVSECTALGFSVPARLTDTQALLEDAGKLVDTTAELVRQFEALTHIPRNLQIRALKVEASGGPLSVLCQNYNGLSYKMKKWFDDNVVGESNVFAEIKTRVGEALLLLSSAELLHRCSMQLQAERRALDGIEIEQEREYLAELFEAYQRQSQDAYRAVQMTSRAIVANCMSMKRMLAGLDTVRVAFKIEGTQSAGIRAGLGEIIDELQASQEACDASRERIVEHAEQIARLAEALEHHKPDPVPDNLLYGPAMAQALSKAS